jgi:hypothetical protein
MSGGFSEAQTESITKLRAIWAALPSCTDPLDHAAAERAVLDLYRGMGMSAPRIVWCASPLGILLADICAESQLVRRAGDTVPVPVDESPIDWLTHKFETNLDAAEWAPCRTLGVDLPLKTLQDLYEQVTGNPLKIGKQVLGVSRFPKARWSSQSRGRHNAELYRVWGPAARVDDVRSALATWGKHIVGDKRETPMTTEHHLRSVIGPVRQALQSASRFLGETVPSDDRAVSEFLDALGDQLILLNDIHQKYMGTPHHLYMLDDYRSARFAASDWTKGCFEHGLATLTGRTLDHDLFALTRLRLASHWHLLAPDRCWLSERPERIMPVIDEDGITRHCEFTYRDGWTTSEWH